MANARSDTVRSRSVRVAIGLPSLSSNYFDYFSKFTNLLNNDKLNNFVQLNSVSPSNIILFRKREV